MKCHFVYAVPSPQNSPFHKVRRKLLSLVSRLGLQVNLIGNRHPVLSDFSVWPTQSPYENTRNIYEALAKHLPTSLYHLTERVRCNFAPDDIFLGHPYFPHDKNGWGVTELAAQEKVRPRTFALISPLHCDTYIRTTHINKEYLDDVNRLMPVTDILFAIMGEYWWDRWDSSPYAHWKPKMVRLDMAVDTGKYPRLKHRFNPPGERGFLFIGSSDDLRKGSAHFSRLMEAFGECRKGWIGGGPEIPGVPRISGHRSLTPEFMAKIAEDYDFFISTAVADPNPTTILECMGWGFPVVCTPQSGYYETDYRRNIYLDDFEKSVLVLRELQNADDDAIMQMANQARQVVESEYTWEIFCETIIKHLKPDVSSIHGSNYDHEQ